MITSTLRRAEFLRLSDALKQCRGRDFENHGHPGVVFDRATGPSIRVWGWWTQDEPAIPCLLWCGEQGWSATVVEPDELDGPGYELAFWSHRIKLLDLALANALGPYPSLRELELHVAADTALGLGSHGSRMKEALLWGILQLLGVAPSGFAAVRRRVQRPRRRKHSAAWWTRNWCATHSSRASRSPGPSRPASQKIPRSTPLSARCAGSDSVTTRSATTSESSRSEPLPVFGAQGKHQNDTLTTSTRHARARGTLGVSSVSPTSRRNPQHRQLLGEQMNTDEDPTVADTSPAFDSSPGDSSRAAARLLEVAARNAEELLADAKAEADQVKGSAREEADLLLAAARAEAQRVRADLEETRVQHGAEIARLQQVAQEHRERMRRHLTDVLAQIEKGPPE